jgi:hypothetical protein
MCLSQVIIEENPDGSMPAHTKGREGNLPVGTQIRTLRMLGPLDGALGETTVGHPFCRFVPRSSCFGWF